ncbi:uncharacterized protein [Onthophagus taurus]|uniref:uncharacterized protein n=1 Tax=Onthophagus taurus TaxID=166361 RepID=UPI0039BE8960
MRFTIIISLLILVSSSYGKSCDNEYVKVKIWKFKSTIPPAKDLKLEENTTLLLPNSSSPILCCNLLIFIFSHPDHFEHREAIRESWGSYERVKNNTVCKRFFVGITNNEDIQSKLNDEYYEYNDIVQVNCTESDATTKSLQMLKVIYLYYQNCTEFILKTIDSVYINLEPIWNILPKLPHLFLAGNLQVEEIATKCTEKCSDKFYPRYLLSSLWLMSLDTAIKLFKTAATTPYFEIEDVYITGYLAEKLSINRTDFPMFTYIENKINPCILKKIVISQNMTPNDIMMVHEKLTDVNLNCTKTICNLPTPQVNPNFSDDVKCFNLDTFKTLILPKNFCRKSSNLLIIIASATKNNLRRDAIRETWGNLRSERKAQKYFLLGNDNFKIQELILKESYFYQDIIQVDFEDTKYNLTLKSIVMLKLVTTFCKQNVTYLVKTDDDSYINVNYLEWVLMKREPKRVLVGILYKNSPRRTNTIDKWYIPKNIYKKKHYPNYLSGAGYVMSMDVANLLYQKSFEEMLYVLEDVFITGMLAKAVNIKPCTFHGYEMEQRPKKIDWPKCSFSSFVISHPRTSIDMNDVDDLVKLAQSSNCKKCYHLPQC